MKKTLFFLAALLTATIAFAQTEINGIYYNLNDSNQTAAVTYQDEWGSDNYPDITSITIPEKVIHNSTEYSVTSIEGGAFYNCSSLRSITIGNSVTIIGYYAFVGCFPDTLICKFGSNVEIYFGFEEIDYLRYFEGPAELVGINRGSVLTEVHVTDGELNTSLFNNINRSKKSLHTIDLAGATNTTLNDLAFYDCYKLENLTLPKNVETIGYKAFADCKHLTELTIPASVTEIGESAFENCRSISELTFEEGSNLETIDSWAFYNNHNLLSVEIPEGVKEIGDAAFYGCTYLENITLPSSVERIGDNGFALCNQVKRMEVRATTPPTIKAKTFHQVSRDIDFVVPAEAREAYAADEYWKEFIPETDAVENIIEGIEIYTQNGTLYLEGLTTDYQIYNMSGQMVYSGNASTLDLTKGIYIIRIADKSQKIVL